MPIAPSHRYSLENHSDAAAAISGAFTGFAFGLLRQLVSAAQSGDLSGPRLKTFHGGVVAQVQDSWQSVLWQGEPCDQMAEWVPEAIDRGEALIHDHWIVAPLRSHEAADGVSDGRVAALVMSTESDVTWQKAIPTIVALFEQAWSLSRTAQFDARQLAQVTSILRASVDWYRLDSSEALLNAIAQCACDVLDCERATIFLWDSRKKRLIGRPALGVEGGELLVDADMGIVGEVLQSQQARWWSSGGDDAGRVNWRIDQAQNFQTRSLLAVPLFGLNEKIIGVFEAINAKNSASATQTAVTGDTMVDRTNPRFSAADVDTLTHLAAHAAAAIETQRTRADLTSSRDRLVNQVAEGFPLVGEHVSIRELRSTVAKVANTDLSVLVLGQNGTGKEVLARQIHYQSGRRNGPFIAVNCAALVESLLESELFGHEKGAFTDASSTRQGKFESASGGTLFLDEVGDMSASGQAKLLRVLEEKVVVRVGGSQTIPVDVRVIAATNQPLQEMIASKRFREDLFFRLNVVSLTLPPLSRRGDDVLLLANHFLAEFSQQIGRAVPTLSEDAADLMRGHQWPGNIRELRNTMERVCYLSDGDSIAGKDLGITVVASASGKPIPFIQNDGLNEATRDFQIAHIDQAIQACNGNMTAAATKLGLHRSNLYRKMRQLGMPTSS
ncbi:MAG: sigma-54-dependent Fis family transcriptional regulator [Planctomycetota bacterium]